MKFRLLIGLLFLITTTVFSQNKNKVLIIGIDGCRPDVLLHAKTKNIDKLWKKGAYSFNAKTDELSSSGICWTGMLTGVWHKKHKVVSNSYKNPNINEYPHFFRRLKQEKPSLKTYSIIHWDPLHKILQDGDADVFETIKSDEGVTESVISYLLNEEIDAMFVHLDDVDHAGHKYGYKSNVKEYVQSIEKIDDQVGRIVKSLKRRENYKKENWLILLSTDHGGSEYGHGKNIPEHTTIFYIASGKSTKKGEIKEKVHVIDVAATALKHLGLTIKEEWNLDAKPKGLKK